MNNKKKININIIDNDNELTLEFVYNPNIEDINISVSDDTLILKKVKKVS